MLDKLADPSHPIWKVIRLVVVCVAIVVVFSVAYTHPIGKIDIVPIVTILATLAGFDQLKAAVTKEEE